MLLVTVHLKSPRHYPVDPFTSLFKVMAKVKLDDHSGLQFILYAYFHFVATKQSLAEI